MHIPKLGKEVVRYNYFDELLDTTLPQSYTLDHSFFIRCIIVICIYVFL
jgi:hypothetical protein